MGRTTMTSIAELRREYASRALTEAAALDDPIQQFALWFGEALKSELLDTNAMTLATASRDGEPSARIVLLKGFDETGFVFFTNYESAKAADLERNPRACLLLFWAALERQVRISGRVSEDVRAGIRNYFQSRPFESQIGAWASAQSRTLGDRASLEARYAELAASMPAVRCRCRRFGAATACSPRRSSSGRAAKKPACTIACFTRRTRARECARGWRHSPRTQHRIE